MRMLRLLVVSACAAMAGTVAIGADGPAGVGRGAIDASTVTLPCVPVGTYWVGPVPPEGTPVTPELAIVDTDIRPKDARVYLDDRFVGRARYLDGSPGYLYLEPGSYSLELRLGGYRTVTVELEATAGCRYNLKHLLERVPGEPAERKSGPYGKGKPLQRVFAPAGGPAEERVEAVSGGPNLALRPDIEGRGVEPGTAPARDDASLRLRIVPDVATVAIDGVVVATGRELARMEAPLATTAGSHRIEVSAPGHTTEVRTVDLEAGQLLELAITLDEAPASGQK